MSLEETITLYLEGAISLNRAAENEDMATEDFINELRSKGIKRLTGYSTIEDKEEEQRALQKYAKTDENS
ncbi:MAG: hypothetical protein INQ03_00720 [Candidatus Heimdallarchaeota archaeon]|nr:hypothetical protein [Candidatus Heimdallarchaeota archaeon]